MISDYKFDYQNLDIITMLILRQILQNIFNKILESMCINV
jgi:hypothetical protein